MPKTMIASKTKPAKATATSRMTLAETMTALKRAGSEQTRKTYARHGVTGPMFGVSFATLKTLAKKIRVDHELALALWETGNFDARNLSYKIVNPARMTPAELDRWASEPIARMCGAYVAHIAAEGPHGHSRADKWLSSKNEMQRHMGWALVAALAMCDATMPDAWFAQRLNEIEKTIHTSPNAQRYIMNHAMIMIGCRSAALRKAATAAAKRIGKVEVDHGDTSCKTPEAVAYIDKCWAHAISKKFESPAAQERERESMRTRC